MLPHAAKLAALPLICSSRRRLLGRCGRGHHDDYSDRRSILQQLTAASQPTDTLRQHLEFQNHHERLFSAVLSANWLYSQLQSVNGTAAFSCRSPHKISLYFKPLTRNRIL